MPAAYTCPPEPVEGRGVAPCSVQAGASEEPELGTSCSPARKLFQRTLSPADVLHVHSYAKGDYGDGEATPKEEKKSDSSDTEMERDSRHVRRAVSGYKCFLLIRLDHGVYQGCLYNVAPQLQVRPLMHSAQLCFCMSMAAMTCQWLAVYGVMHSGPLLWMIHAFTVEQLLNS